MQLNYCSNPRTRQFEEKLLLLQLQPQNKKIFTYFQPSTPVIYSL